MSPTPAPPAPEGLGAVFAPRSVAVIGASRDPNSIGFRTLESLVMTRFNGPVYPVNPHAEFVGSIRAYPAVGDIPGPVDLAVIAVPRDAVNDVAEQCGRAGVRALVVLSAGFAETGPEGAAHQTELVATVRRHGMRMVGPNCMGVMSTDPDVRLNATFSSVFPPHGTIAMSSQSGALGLAILGLARRRELGLSHFVSVGNKADVTGNDLLEYWDADPQTRVVLLYLESFGNPQRFARVARAVSRSKPVVAVKAGRTGAGSRAAGSHTAALAASDAIVDALFHQTGVIRAETLNEMFDLALALDSQPTPRGDRVAIVTNAGGPAILCADSCEAGGLVVPELSGLGRALDFLPGAASLTNPIDMIASASPEDYTKAIAAVLGAEEIDSLIVVYIPVDRSREPEYLRAIAAGVVEGRKTGGEGKPVLVCSMSDEGVTVPIRHGGEVLPAYPFPEAAARALVKVTQYAELKDKPVGHALTLPDAAAAEINAVCRSAAEARGGGWLTALETRAVLTSALLPALPGGVATTAESAAQVAESIGFPVAVKLASHAIVHKTEYQALRLHLASPDEVREAFRSIEAGLAARGRSGDMEGVLVQPMIGDGVEVMVGGLRDPQFGPVVTFGLGGIHVEILADIALRVAPVTDVDAAEMVRAIRGYKLLQGYRGHAPGDVSALETLLQRVSALLEACPLITEMDLNPVFALAPGAGSAIVDARIRVRA